MIVINLWGAPSSGKSTIAAGLFFLMKINKMKVELVTEFAKELHLEKRENVFGEQNYIFAEQHRRLSRLQGHPYDYAIIDSPIPLPAFYDENKANDHFERFVFAEFSRFDNLNYFLARRHAFEDIGRRHDEQQAIRIDADMRRFLERNAIDFTPMDANPKTPERILADILARRAAPTTALPFEGLDDPQAR